MFAARSALRPMDGTSMPVILDIQSDSILDRSEGFMCPRASVLAYIFARIHLRVGE
jgi:hypothetical protein